MVLTVADRDPIQAHTMHLADGDRLLLTITHDGCGKPVELLLTRVAADHLKSALAKATS